MERDNSSRPRQPSAPRTTGDVFLEGMKAMHAPEREAPRERAPVPEQQRAVKQRPQTDNFSRLPAAEKADRLATARNEVPTRTLETAERIEKMAERIQTPRPAASQAKAIIKDAIEHRQAREYAGIKATPQTHAKYDALAKQLVRDGKLPEEAGITKASFFAYRAAVVRDATVSGQQAARDFAVAVKLERQLKQQAKSDKTPELRQQILSAGARKADAKNRLTAAAQVLSAYRPGEADRAKNLCRDGYQKLYKANPEKARSTSKRDAEAALPRGWQEKIFDNAQRGDRPAVAVLSVSGARPAEVQKGVKVQRQDDGGLKLTIKGVKSDEYRGAKTREVALSKEQVQNDKQAAYLHKIAGGRGGTTVKTKDSEALSRRIAKIGDREGLDVSGYSFRHGFATDGRKKGLTDKELSPFMGHRSERSTGSYGARR